ncbi:hypothetical protein Q9966_003470 [Columba livia]|nr:hypothetical protein Q9966_003470 [Columba livia]
MEHSFMLFSQLSAPSSMTGSAAFQLLTSHYRPSWEHAALWLETNVWALITIWRENEIQGQLNLASRGGKAATCLDPQHSHQHSAAEVPDLYPGMELTTNIVFLAIEAFSLPMCTIVAVFPGFASEINATELSKNNRVFGQVQTSLELVNTAEDAFCIWSLTMPNSDVFLKVQHVVELECVVTDNTADDRGPCFESLRHFCDMPYAYTSNSYVGTLQEGMGCAQRGEGRQMKIFKLPSLSEITYLEIHSQFRSEVLKPCQMLVRNLTTPVILDVEFLLCGVLGGKGDCCLRTPAPSLLSRAGTVASIAVLARGYQAVRVLICRGAQHLRKSGHLWWSEKDSSSPTQIFGRRQREKLAMAAVSGGKTVTSKCCALTEDSCTEENNDSGQGDLRENLPPKWLYFKLTYKPNFDFGCIYGFILSCQTAIN